MVDGGDDGVDEHGEHAQQHQQPQHAVTHDTRVVTHDTPTGDVTTSNSTL